MLLRGKPSPRRSWFYGPAYRSGNYKIHLATNDFADDPHTRKWLPRTRHDPPLLFDLSKDLSERNNIAAEHPEILARLVKEMQSFRDGMR